MTTRTPVHCELEKDFAHEFLEQSIAFEAPTGEFVEALFLEVQRLAKRSGQTVAEYLLNELPKPDRIELQRHGKIDYDSDERTTGGANAIGEVVQHMITQGKLPPLSKS